MVLHLFERLFGANGDPKAYFSNQSNLDYLIAEGFSEEEAKNLLWFDNKRTWGKIWGVAAGIFTLFATNHRFERLRFYSPRFYYNSWAIPSLKAFVVFTGYLLGDYLAVSSQRKAANSQWANLYTPAEYLKTRELFIQSFEPLNRKFTLDEIQHFYFNGVRNSGKDRKWIYNPYIHGDKDIYEATTEAFEKQEKIADHPQVKLKIHQQNLEKIRVGENILEKPYNLNNFIDRRGYKQQFERIPFLTGWRPLH